MLLIHWGSRGWISILALLIRSLHWWWICELRKLWSRLRDNLRALLLGSGIIDWSLQRLMEMFWVLLKVREFREAGMWVRSNLSHLRSFSCAVAILSDLTGVRTRKDNVILLRSLNFLEVLSRWLFLLMVICKSLAWALIIADIWFYLSSRLRNWAFNRLLQKDEIITCPDFLLNVYSEYIKDTSQHRIWSIQWVFISFQSSSKALNIVLEYVKHFLHTGCDFPTFKWGVCSF
jgi:hypothetical protein